MHAADVEVDALSRAGVPAGAEAGGEDLAGFERELAPLLQPAYRLALALRLDPAQAEDAVQEAALRAWSRRHNRRPGSPLQPWFLGIVANRCREARRGRWAGLLRFAAPPERAAVEPDPATALDVRRALASLPHAPRLALALRFYLDLTFADVGAVLGCSPDAAKARVHRATAALRSALAPAEDPR